MHFATKRNKATAEFMFASPADLGRIRRRCHAPWRFWLEPFQVPRSWIVFYFIFCEIWNFKQPTCRPKPKFYEVQTLTFLKVNSCFEKNSKWKLTQKREWIDSLLPSEKGGPNPQFQEARDWWSCFWGKMILGIAGTSAFCRNRWVDEKWPLIADFLWWINHPLGENRRASVKPEASKVRHWKCCTTKSGGLVFLPTGKEYILILLSFFWF